MKVKIVGIIFSYSIAVACIPHLKLLLQFPSYKSILPLCSSDSYHSLPSCCLGSYAYKRKEI